MSSSKERGDLLTVWLILMLLANTATVLLYLALALSPVNLSFFLPNIAAWTVYLFIAFGLWNIACVCFLFLWKKWAFLRLCGSAAVVLAVNLYVGVGALAFVGLLGAVFTFLVLRPKWSLLDNF